MIRNIIKTSDGSTTIFLPEWQETYHSTHGAIQEAYHVFIKNGFYHCLEQRKLNAIHLLEIGFGTGLNCLITCLESEKSSIIIDYVGIEAFPITDAEFQQLNYIDELNLNDKKTVFEAIHQAIWNKKTKISPHFNLLKRLDKFENIRDENCYDLIYFDCFGAQVQPELWTEIIFEKMYKALKLNGILVTYAAKGSVRRAMQTVGFQVERLAGPPGKREKLRALKL
ncbi:MAG: tRNA (5-methylaminomethyl-2-thiouridine)(34)-methyltransferase MnmD [Flavobacteriaceae bacterium]|nr:tRNA (5-methylaminomethyl-2-thiouridine)(34)-methyltransferase MnmD [Flavobacteriaceae bacterium]